MQHVAKSSTGESRSLAARDRNDIQSRRLHTNNQSKSKKSRLHPQSTIGIIGSGLSGLSAAISLKNAGFTNIVIYERDSCFEERKDGYGLTLTYNPRGPLATLGALEEVARADCPSRSHYVFRPDGSILGYYGNAFTPNRGMGQRGNLRVPRQVLRRVLMDKVLEGSKNDVDMKKNECVEESSPVRIIWGKLLQSYVNRTCPRDKHCAQEEHSQQHPIFLQFDDGTSTEVDFLVGADGVRSVVARSLLSNDFGGPNNETTSEGRQEDSSRGLRYLGVMVILGISDFYHPLLDERGFYTVDGTNRLFTMPFEGCRLDDLEGNVGECTVEKVAEAEGKISDCDSDACEGSDCTPCHDQTETTPLPEKECSNLLRHGGRRRRIMWQLSYRLEDEVEATRLSRAGPRALMDEVLRRCRSWHDPVLDMVQTTSLETIWGTGLMDRDPEQFPRRLNEMRDRGISPRVVVVGDAVHAMSPFKGQGANQALADGPLLASWLKKSAVDSAVRGFTREMVMRSAAKVSASREAAAFLHSAQVLCEKQQFAGVPDSAVSSLLELLEQRRIGAGLGETLDGAVRKVVRDLRVCVVPSPIDKPCQNDVALYQERALLFASDGDTVGLRSLSMQHADCIRSARNKKNQSCLYLSALGGHYHACRWLLSEACVAHNDLDAEKRSPLHAAALGGNARVIALLVSVSLEGHQRQAV